MKRQRRGATGRWPFLFRPVAGVAVALLAATLTAPARGAQVEGDVDQAKASFHAGATAYAAGEYLAAIQALERAHEMTPLPAIAFSLAQAHRRQYFASHDRVHLDKAVALFRRYVDEVRSGGRRADALDALSQLEPLAAVVAGGAAAGTGGGPAAEPGAPGTGSAPTRPTRLLITAETPGAQLSLDRSAPVPSPLIREVAPGPHKVAATAPGHFPLNREVTALAGELVPISLTLRERPSTVEISAPRGADIYLDGTFASRGGERVPLKLTSGSHQLIVTQQSRRPSSQVILLKPGEARQLHVTLEPTRMCQVATALLISGGIVAGAAVALATVALDAQRDAESFLAARSRGNVPPESLAAYDETVRDRDRYRTAAAVSLAAAVTLAGTGLLLRQIDVTDPKELLQAGRTRDAGVSPHSPGGEPPPLQLTPIVSSTTLGAAVGRRF